MIVPEYWSEAKTRITHDGKQRTIMRFGWSDTSEDDAHENAKQRVKEAIDHLQVGKPVRARDHKVAYNGAEGLPIREEIVERHGEAVITRNSYGALCLNTPDVVFADIDVETPGFLRSMWLLITGAERNPFATAREGVEKFAVDNPGWLLRLYRTPKGFRVLVMHDTFDPTDERAFEFMQKLGSDPLYMRMCRNQKCFRARISPKPWRIGVEHIKPRPGVWPVKQEKMNARRDWIRRYEQKATRFSSCRYEATLGEGRSDRKCEAIRSVHDRYCKADRDLEIA